MFNDDGCLFTITIQLKLQRAVLYNSQMAPDSLLTYGGTVASQQKDPAFESTGRFWVEFARSPCGCIGFLLLPLTVQTLPKLTGVS